jgi:serine/arginine repetitive matrix protein 1
MKFPAEFNEKVLQISYCDFLMFNCQVDFSKIKLDVISAWVTKRVTEILGFEDDVVINMVNSYLQGKEVDPKKMQLNLTGFLEKDTAAFVTDLWRLLLDAQQHSGIPSVMMDEIKEELRKRKEESSRIEKGIEMSQQRSQVKSEDTRVKKEQDNGDVRRERNRDSERTSQRGRDDRERERDSERRRERSRERNRDSERRRRERERRRSRSRSRSRSKERRHKRKRSRSSSSESRSDERRKRSRADERSRKEESKDTGSVPAESILETKLREEALKSMKK